jgi:hypothetical protein
MCYYNICMYTFIHNMIVTYIADYKTYQLFEISTINAKGVGHIRDNNK